METQAQAQMEMLLNAARSGGGDVASKLLANNMDVGVLRPYIDPETGLCYTANWKGETIQVTNATLLYDDWKQIDDIVLQVTQQRLVGLGYLMSKGLVYRFPNGMGRTVLQWQTASAIEEAQVSMDGVTRSKADRPEFTTNFMPLPITHYDFYYSAREIAAARQSQMPLDTSTAEMAARKVMEKSEYIFFNGNGNYAFGGGNLYGLCNYPDRNIGTLTAAWTAASGDQILTDVLAMIEALIADGFYGPYCLWVPTNYEVALERDFKAASDLTIRQRLMEIDSLADIKVADFMAASNVVMQQNSSDVVRAVEGLPPTSLQWGSDGDMRINFKVLMILLGQIRSDHEGRCGVAHYQP